MHGRRHARALAAVLLTVTAAMGTLPGSDFGKTPNASGMAEAKDAVSGRAPAWGVITAYADEEAIEDTGIDDDSSLSSTAVGGIDADGGDGLSLIEDSGNDEEVTAGVPMDTVQQAIDNNDQQALDKIASLGALTNDGSSSSGSGTSSTGAFRGFDNEEDDDLYDISYSTISMEEEADEVETDESELDERPGILEAANSERIQTCLDSLTEQESATGTEGEMTTASYIESMMTNLGYNVQEQAFHEGVVNDDGVDAPGINILAERGANSQVSRKQDIFLVVTHYDSKTDPSGDDPYANDKTGAAALIEAARIVSGVITDTDICFVFLSGQEDGGYGAASFIESLSDENRARITGVMIIDRIGYDMDGENTLRTVTGEGNYISQRLRELGLMNDEIILRQEAEGYTEEDDDEGYISAGQSTDGTTVTGEALEDLTYDDGSAGVDATDSDESINPDAYQDGIELEDETESEDEDEEEPAAWSYLIDDSSMNSAFGNAGFTAAVLTQYCADLDRELFERTKELGLAESKSEDGIEAATDEESPETDASGAVVLEEANLTQAEDAALQDGIEIEADSEIEVDLEEYDADTPIPDTESIAHTTDVVAAVLAEIMDPTS